MIETSTPRELGQIRAHYKDRHARHSHEAEGYRALGRRIENFRGLSFAGAVVFGALYFLRDDWMFGALALALVLAFLWLVQHHARVLEKESHARRFALVNHHGLKRTTGDWHDLPKSGSNFAPENHEYAGDLDLYGVASLYQRISVAHTRFGQTTLADWIAQPAGLAEIQARQQAMLELAEETEFRQKLEAEGMALVEKRAGDSAQLSDGPNPARLLAWARSPKRLGSAAFRVLPWLAPLVVLAGIIGSVWFGLPPYAWIAPLLLNLILLRVAGPTTSDAFAAVSTTEGAFLRYGTLLQLLEEHDPKTTWLKERKAALLAKEVRPSAVMRRFRTIVSWYDLRHNGMVYPFVNALLLWDIHCTRALENWKAGAGEHLEKWFETIGQYEALSSLAGLFADDPDASLPQVIAHDEPGATLRASMLGHPLLPNHSRVKNDVDAFGPGSALLITGSNMSGKSTFLRALGVNAVLAFMGGPVIATQLTIPTCTLGTSIRISDSLRSGVSHFYAEVKRLAQIVEHCHQDDRPVLFLLDEILHGTNSRERQIGARWVLAELLQHRAFGVITTHDMELCRLPEALMTSVRQHHFREIERSGEMSFDYLLRSGPVTSGNALRLMQRVGLGVPLEENSALS